MAGHSKWANIQHRKGRVDAKRGKVFTRIIKEITVAARLGGGDASANPRLRTALSDAKANNVPKDTIARAIKKGTGELEGEAYEEVVYEGYGPSGVAILVEGVTDNKNRTVSEVRHLFSRGGGNLGENGCVAWMFERRGHFAVDAESLSEEDFFDLALEIGADDLSTEGGSYEIFTAPEDFHRIQDELEGREVALVHKELAMVPTSTVPVEDEQARQVLRFVETLEDHDDVQNVWANFDIDDALLETEAG